MNNVLIVGGTRFLGLAIAEAFLRKGGFRVCEMNRGTRPGMEGLEKSFHCDKNDREAFAQVLKDRPWDVIIDTILNDADLEFVIGTLKSDVGHFIHTGSIGVYGDARHIPAPEWLPMSELESDEEVVFNQKLRQDQILLRACVEKRFPASILRMSNVYGRGDIPLDGWGGRNPEYFRKLLRGEVMEVPENGRALLQPGHVADLGRAFLLCAERSESIGQVYNICGETSLMLKDYIRLVAKTLDAPAPVFEFLDRDTLMQRRPELSRHGLGFVCQHMCSDIRKAEAQLSWRPEIPLEAGLRDNFAWMKEKDLLSSK